uniref:Uncharacterized protein n=1 Tax=Rhizophora mucronata TaxID=61149 RepID=A0A2P2PI48_RHIMU
MHIACQEFEKHKLYKNYHHSTICYFTESGLMAKSRMFP